MQEVKDGKVKPMTQHQIEYLFSSSKSQFNDESIHASDILSILMDGDEFEHGHCYEDYDESSLRDTFHFGPDNISKVPSGYTIENKRWLLQLARLVGYNYIMDVLRAIEKAYAVEAKKYKLLEDLFDDSIR